MRIERERHPKVLLRARRVASALGDFAGQRERQARYRDNDLSEIDVACRGSSTPDVDWRLRKACSNGHEASIGATAVQPLTLREAMLAKCAPRVLFRLFGHLRFTGDAN